MSKRNLLLALFIVLAGASCPRRPAVTPSLVDISGFGRWTKATASTPDTFGFATRPAETCPGGPPSCPRGYPDTAFIDFSIPSQTEFEVSSSGTALTEVSQTTPLGDYQYRKAAMTDGSGTMTTWRIAVSVPAANRTWCPPTWFKLDIVNIGSGNPSRSSALPVQLVWGSCPSVATGYWYSTGRSGTPAANSPPPPAGDCPGGGFARSFEVCERCGTSGLSFPKTLWGCTLSEAQQNMGGPGCTSTLRSGVNCP
jgi:hypothetical protein